MRTIRGRLATWYAVAMGVTLLAFAATVYLVAQKEDQSRLELLDARIQSEAVMIDNILAEAFRFRGSVVTADPISDNPVLSPDVASLLESVPDYLLVLGTGRDPLFIPSNPRAAFEYATLTKFADSARTLESKGGFGDVDLGAPAGRVRFYVHPSRAAGDQVAAIVAGASTTGAIFGPGQLLVVALLIVPLIVIASIGIGYVLAAKTLRPVDKIVDEIEAITDGRSLHRRLGPPPAHEELARLTVTVNEMLGRLERNFLALRRFTADASHELKTPLTVLRSGIERAVTHPKVHPEVQEVLEETHVEVKRMTELVESLLTLARADEGRAPLHLEEVDVREMLSEIAETASLLGEHARVSVDVSIPTEPQVVSVDRNRMRQLLMNLVTNAIKYTPAGGNVWIEAGRKNGNVFVQVRDTGVGIAEGELQHVFDRFWRADLTRSRTRHHAGAGLGLAISKWIAEAHGGSIQAQSKLGRGTTMTVTLP